MKHPSHIDVVGNLVHSLTRSLTLIRGQPRAPSDLRREFSEVEKLASVLKTTEADGATLPYRASTTSMPRRTASRGTVVILLAWRSGVAGGLPGGEIGNLRGDELGEFDLEYLSECQEGANRGVRGFTRAREPTFVLLVGVAAQLCSIRNLLLAEPFCEPRTLQLLPEAAGECFPLRVGVRSGGHDSSLTPRQPFMA